ncbi:MAG: plasmid pRiA4b ORF-3 family protein [Burkholderiales bacterium]|nr:plasmid pRiA4b ORF-3 family protein [Burkholderiales bacterium]
MSTEIYQLKITALGIKPSIWRTILIPANATFLDLHDVIMLLFGFEDVHLFAFSDNGGYADQIGDGSDGTKSATKVKLFQKFTDIDKMNYTYDFGDDWNFSIVLQKTLPLTKDAIYPQCIKWKGGMMLEDCGSYYGYEMITNWCRNKTKKNANVLIDYYGDDEILETYADFNPDKFDVNSITLKQL